MCWSIYLNVNGSPGRVTEVRCTGEGRGWLKFKFSRKWSCRWRWKSERLRKLGPGPGSCWLAFNAFGPCSRTWLGTRTWWSVVHSKNKKYETHKPKLAANLRWHRRMRIVLYLFAGIKPFKKRRHKIPQSAAIKLWSPLHRKAIPFPFCQPKAIKSNLFGFVRASFLFVAGWDVDVEFLAPFYAGALQPKSMPSIFHNSLSFAAKSAALFHFGFKFLSMSKLIIILAIYFMAQSGAEDEEEEWRSGGAATIVFTCKCFLPHAAEHLYANRCTYMHVSWLPVFSPQFPTLSLSCRCLQLQLLSPVLRFSVFHSTARHTQKEISTKRQMLQYYKGAKRSYLEWLLQKLEGCLSTRSSGKKIAEVAKIIAVGNFELTHTNTYITNTLAETHTTLKTECACDKNKVTAKTIANLCN